MILLSKNLRKKVARSALDVELGRTGRVLRDSNELRVDQSRRGWSLCFWIRER